MKKVAMPKMPAGKMPAPKSAMPKPPMRGPVMMANGGSVKKMSQMAGNAKSGTCGPGKASR